ncbi:drug resistance transporter, EmrB/QacA subfamily [Actinomadura meyerae]|jgi:EmrB/QacA subfamily drug resistance transporter|uniref:Drug resistance transporter, EmrB/QacA subfamily n=1 Tax=Actinomadura meyerae TaxID=240840 RepID=A0A239NFF1_9ACTN|nr:MFS transporter [Actinomadura meyerae]SNT53697.1 drug resistance transporter, EmrB/QacA subfamily [Actinomadura meyerae]
MSERTAAAGDAPRTKAPEGADRTARGLGIALALIVTLQLMVVVDTAIVNIALPDIQAELHFSPTGLAWVLSAYTLPFGGLLLLGGRLSDVFGHRRMFVLGVALFTIASLVGGIAQNSETLLAARAAQGIGAAFAAPGSLALIATNFPAGEARNKALGMFTMAAGFGMVLGLVLGGVLATASWRWVMFVNVPFGALITVLSHRYITESARNPARFDLSGALTSTIGMTSLVYGLIRAASNGWGDGQTRWSIGIAVVLLAAFVAIETRTRDAIMPLRLFADRTRSAAYFCMFLLPATMSSMFFFLSQFAQEVLRFSPLTAGLSFLPMAVTQLLAARYAPKLIPRMGSKNVALVGIVGTVAASLWLSRLSADSLYWVDVAGPTVLFGLGVGLCFMPLSAVILAGLPPQDAGAASGTLQTLQRVGGSLGIAILVTVYGTALRNAADDPDPALTAAQRAQEGLAHGIATAFLAGAVFAVLSLIVTLVFVKVRKPPAQT